MSRIINLESAGKERIQKTKYVALAVRELARQHEYGNESRDLAAFIAMALTTISKTIDVSVTAWEKRDYWVKADKFRMEWAWSGVYAGKMKQAILIQDWDTITRITTQIAQKLNYVIIAPGHRMGRPWVGAWNVLQKQ